MITDVSCGLSLQVTGLLVHLSTCSLVTMSSLQATCLLVYSLTCLLVLMLPCLPYKQLVYLSTCSLVHLNNYLYKTNKGTD